MTTSSRMGAWLVPCLLDSGQGMPLHCCMTTPLPDKTPIFCHLCTARGGNTLLLHVGGSLGAASEQHFQLRACNMQNEGKTGRTAAAKKWRGRPDERGRGRDKPKSAKRKCAMVVVQSYRWMHERVASNEMWTR